MSNTLVFYQIGELVTMKGPKGLRQGKAMNEVEIIKDGYFVVRDGKFHEVGSGMGYLKYQDNATFVRAMGRTVTPGLIDSHTHLVHGGSREYELSMKLAGKSYLDILHAGGGIHDTVEKTKQASFDELYFKARKTLYKMLEHGITAVEAKSGYGLEYDTEMKQLEVVRKLQETQPMEIVSTFLGAHAVPKRYKDDKKAWIKELKEIMVAVKKADLAKYCDVFCEEGVFTIEESREILEYAKSLGFQCKIHADEVAPLGGAGLAAELGCVSADHLMATTEEDMKKLAKAKVVANILPLTSFYLNKPFVDARKLIEHGCGLAIATDYNPGSSPSENLQLAMQFAALKGNMSAKETITAVTINAAVSLGIDEAKGTIEVGKDADFVVFDAPNLDYLIYHFGINQVKNVYLKGKLTVRNQRIVGDFL